MPYFADGVKDTTTSTGTGSITLANSAPTGYQTFAAAFSQIGLSGSMTVVYRIETQTTGAEWEVGKGVFNGTTGLTRDTVRSSSNSGALVNFSAGTKDVMLVASSEQIDNANIGQILAQSRGWAMP